MNDPNSPVTKADLKAALADQEMRLLERIEKTETTLLREFRKWAVSFTAGAMPTDPRSRTA